MFWDLSLQEIYDLIESYNRNKNIEAEQVKEELKAQISLNSVLARQIGEYVACLFEKKAKITPLDKMFPELFKSEDTKDKENKREMAVYKAKMEDFAYKHNSKLKKGGNKL